MNEYKLQNEYFTGMIHEMKMPITIILNAVQLMESNYSFINKEQKLNFLKYISIIKKNCYSFIHIINNYLDMARIDSKNYEVNLKNCNVVKLVIEIVESVKTYSESKNISIKVSAKTEKIITAVDKYKIERIILNLLSNAIKFTDSGGSIEVYTYTSDDKLYISVKDNGPGIPQKMHKKIFKKFIQIKYNSISQLNGSGLGLGLVKSFTEMLGGKVILKSEENKGSVFTIELPLKIYKIPTCIVLLIVLQ
jgi:two-component system, cell cycle sensor histidine kinase PleC